MPDVIDMSIMPPTRKPRRIPRFTHGTARHSSVAWSFSAALTLSALERIEKLSDHDSAHHREGPNRRVSTQSASIRLSSSLRFDSLTQ